MVGIQYRQKTGEGVWHRHSKLQQVEGREGLGHTAAGHARLRRGPGQARVDIRTSKKDRHIPGRKADPGNPGWAACWIESGQCHQQEASRIRVQAAGLGVRGRDPRTHLRIAGQ